MFNYKSMSFVGSARKPGVSSSNSHRFWSWKHLSRFVVKFYFRPSTEILSYICADSNTLSRAQAISTDSTMISSACSNMADFHPRQITFSWGITSIVASSLSRRLPCFYVTRSSTLKTFSSYEATMRLQVPIESMGFTTSVSLDT